MRQIDGLVKFIAKLVFKKDTTEYEIFDETNLSETDLLYLKLQEFISLKKLCEGEDLLFDSFNPQDESHINLALDFYQKLNLMSDEELDGANFPRSEIADGLKDILALVGIPLPKN